LPLNEDIFWKKSGKESDYSISKYNAEREVWRGIEEGLSAVIVNPGIVLSPGFWNQSSSVLFSTCLKGNKFYTNGSSAYIGALDLSAIMLELVSAKNFGSRYIIIENNYSYHFILSEIQKQLNKTPPSIKISKWQMRLGRLASQFASNFTKNHPLISSSMINSAFNTQTFSNQKILALTKRQITPINQVINEICKIYLSENQKE
jgi:thioester reductase-like protein